MNYKGFADLSDDIRNNINKISSYDFDLIVGVPRSGMVPAYIIASMLNKNCTDIVSLAENHTLKKGRTRVIKPDLNLPSDAKKILLVDDSILTGGSLKSELEKLSTDIKDKIVTLAIYSSLPYRNDIDLFFEYVPLPRVFEWNMYHHSIIGESCVDIDGVLCLDPTEKENDDGEKYCSFLLNAKPLILPSGTIHTLITNRLEKYRPETEIWLHKYNIEYQNLVMLDLPSKKERQRQEIHAKHKAEYYSKSDLSFFIESSQNQAEAICMLSKKPVFCVEVNKLYTVNSIVTSGLRHKNTVTFYVKGFVRKLPTPFRKLIIKIYKFGRT